ncbi:hypothetical protein D6833_02075, partial [Candidatus Parcubacteria bacterium]
MRVWIGWLVLGVATGAYAAEKPEVVPVQVRLHLSAERMLMPDRAEVIYRVEAEGKRPNALRLEINRKLKLIHALHWP